MRARTVLIAASCLLTVACLPACTNGGGATILTARPSSGAASPSATTPSPTQAAPDRLTFVGARGSSLLLDGTYPRVSSRCVRPQQPRLHARYTGTIEVGRGASGKLFAIGVLPFEDYLKGIAEVPRLWPMEALKTQAVAARTYALAHLGNPGAEGQALGYQICATDACQVYLGLGISNGPYGDRWRRAVDATSRQVLLYGGRPADTVYFSTSNGRTLGNDQVFGSSPLPYLRPVPERDDGASPLSHWVARIRLRDVARFLRTAGDWPNVPISSVTQSGGTMVVRGGGKVARFSMSHFRSDLNSWAHCLQPDRYPSSDSSGQLPQTVPSIWFSGSSRGGTLILRGRGWGHGVGMVQWGAFGKAQRGLTYRQILAYYYGGLRPTVRSEPRTIRVAIAVGLKSLRIEGTGPVTANGTSIASGPWLVTGGRALHVRPAGAVVPSIQAATFLRAPGSATEGQRIVVSVSVPQLSVIRLLLTSEVGEVVLSRAETIQAGRAALFGRIPSVAAGSYELVVEASNGIDIVRSPPRPITIAASASVSSSP